MKPKKSGDSIKCRVEIMIMMLLTTEECLGPSRVR